MTIHASGFNLICDKCHRVEVIPALDLAKARELEKKLGWFGLNEQDFCPSCKLTLKKTPN